MSFLQQPPNFGLRTLDAGSFGADINDLAIGESCSIFINPTSTIALNGIAGGVDGRVIWIVNRSTTNRMIIAHEALGSATANRIHTAGLTGGNVPIALFPMRSKMMLYDATLARWRCLRWDADFITDSNTGAPYPIGTLVAGQMLVNSGGVITSQAIPGGGADARTVLRLQGREFSTNSTSYVSTGERVPINFDRFPAGYIVRILYRIKKDASPTNAQARLLSNGVELAGSEVTTTSTSYELKETAEIARPAGLKTLEVELKQTGGSGGSKSGYLDGVVLLVGKAGN